MGRISRSLLDATWVSGNDLNWDSTAIESRLTAAHDVSNGCVVWMVPRPSDDPIFLSYSYTADEFTVIEVPPQTSSATVLGAFSNPDTADAFYPLRDVLYSVSYVTGPSTYKKLYGFFSGGGSHYTGDAYLRTGYLDLASAKNTIIRRVRPVATANGGAANARPSR